MSIMTIRETGEATFDELRDVIDRAGSADYLVLVDAEPFIEFNCAPGGYYDDGDEEHIESFKAYVENEWQDAIDVEAGPDGMWGIVYCEEGYSFAMPYDEPIRYRVEEWE